MRRQYEALLDDMQTGDFRQSVLRAIEAEQVLFCFASAAISMSLIQSHKASLKQRVDFLEKQVQHLQQDGVRLLKQRLTEVRTLLFDVSSLHGGHFFSSMKYCKVV